MSIFTKRIKCLHCQGNFKRRRNRSNFIWICSRRENGYTSCPRVQIDEQFLIDFINRRIRSNNQEELEDEIKSKLVQVEVNDKYDFKVKFNDGSFMEMNIDEKKIVY